MIEPSERVRKALEVMKALPEITIELVPENDPEEIVKLHFMRNGRIRGILRTKRKNATQYLKEGWVYAKS